MVGFLRVFRLFYAFRLLRLPATGFDDPCHTKQIINF
jgi:hypothetical protein